MSIAGIVDPSFDPGLPGGRALVELGRRVGTMNRVVDATAPPIGCERREVNAALIANFGLDAFPHARH